MNHMYIPQTHPDCPVRWSRTLAQRCPSWARQWGPVNDVSADISGSYWGADMNMTLLRSLAI